MKLNKRYKICIIVLSCALISIAIHGCKKEEKDVTPSNPENEFITTILLKCINQNDASDTITGKWVDLTPEDINPPDTSNAILNLKKNAVYDCEILLYDETGTEIEVISDEVRDRQNYHIFCFSTTGGNLNTNFSIAATDFDTNTPPLPVGLNNDITTLNADSGILNVVLRHQPNGKDGNCSAGSADVDVNFRINIY